MHFDFHLREGQLIKVGAGPFADLIGRLETLDDKGRVNVLLEMLGERSGVDARLTGANQVARGAMVHAENLAPSP